MLDEATRQRIMLHQEGAVLANVVNIGTENACEAAQCQLDGIANALIRMRGAEDAARFVFALSDRVAGGVRDVTDYWPTSAVEKLIEHEPLPAPIKREKRVPDFAYGFLCGLAAMATITWLTMVMV